MSRFWAALAFRLALASGAGAHEITFSRIDLRLGAGETRIGARLPIKALAHGAVVLAGAAWFVQRLSG